jgi:hypothetical protein
MLMKNIHITIRKYLSAVLIIVLFSVTFPIPQVNANGLTLTTTLKLGGQPVKNQFSTMNFWDFSWNWLSEAEGKDPNYFRQNYPFVKTVIFMMATGGEASRDLLANPKDPNSAYNFSKLVRACRNAVNQGLKPFIKTGNVPEVYSNNPWKRAYSVNVRPPADYNKYYNYIKALADTLVKEFGVNEVKTWYWGVLNEFDNGDIFTANDGTGNGSKLAYFKLYDYTVAALEDSIGASNVHVGGHAMFTAGSFWNPLELLDHTTKGTNYKTGKRGTQIDHFNISYYDYSPQSSGDFSALASTLRAVRNKANSVNLPNLIIGLDEGVFIVGPDGGDLDNTRNIGPSYQGSYDAWLFKTMTENSGDYYSRWAVNTSLWNGADSVGANVSKLAYKMVGDNLLNIAKSGAPADSSNNVDAVASYNDSTKTAHVLIFNHSRDFNRKSNETINLQIGDIAPLNGNSLTVKQWIVDDTHGNFWPTWWKDKTAQGIQAVFSQYDLQPTFANSSHLSYFNSRLSTYKSLGALMAPITTNVTVDNNTLRLPTTLSHHSVTFYEITNAKIASIASTPTPTPTPAPTPKFTIPLSKGWNLISTPLKPSALDISSALSSINSKFASLYAYDGNQYLGFIPGSSSNQLQKLETGLGYWILMHEAADLVIEGTPAWSTTEVNLRRGWNLIGLSSQVEVPVMEALSSISGKYLSVYEYDNATNSYKGLPDLKTLKPGKGYWLEATSDAVWTLGSSSTPTPTPIPTPTGNSLTLQAESFNAMSGVSAVGDHVADTDNGDWIRFDNVNMGSGYSTFTARLAVPAAHAGSKVEIRLDSMEGSMVGELRTRSTGSWTSYEEQSVSVSGASGVHTIYIKFVGGYGVGDFDWFKFSN